MDRDISLDAIKWPAFLYVLFTHRDVLCLSLQIFIYPIFYFICQGIAVPLFLW